MNMNYISVLVANLALVAAILIVAPGTHAQTFTQLKSFSGSEGSFPNGGLTLSDGVLYGITGGGGLSNAGTLFRLNANGSGFNVIHHFTGGSDGSLPNGRVVVSGNTIYGVTYRGGTNDGIEDGGTIYRVNADGSNYSILRRLDRAVGDGIKPFSGLVLSGSTLYGVATGGASNGGAVYKINTNGTGYQNIHSFNSATEGFQPEAELTLMGNILYGTTAFGGFATLNGGMLFKLGLDGTGFTVLYTFTNLFTLRSCDRTSRLTPVGNLFYGVGTSLANDDSVSSVYKINTDGSGFQIVGQLPAGLRICDALTWTGSELVGAAWLDDLGSFDRIFQIKTNGTGYHELKIFAAFGSSDASFPLGDFVLSGTLIYGSAVNGGASNAGTVFSFDLRPRLAIAAAGDMVKLSWPSYAQDYQLEQSPTLASSSWTNVTSPPADDGTNRTVLVPVSAASPARLHRLRR